MCLTSLNSFHHIFSGVFWEPEKQYFLKYILHNDSSLYEHYDRSISGTVSRPILTRFLTVVGDKISDADAEKIMSTALEKGGKLVNIDKIVKQVMGPVEWFLIGQMQ